MNFIISFDYSDFNNYDVNLKMCSSNIICNSGHENELNKFNNNECIISNNNKILRDKYYVTTILFSKYYIDTCQYTIIILYTNYKITIVSQ